MPKTKKPDLDAILDALVPAEDFGVVHRKGCVEKLKSEQKKPFFKGPGRCPTCGAKSDLWLPGSETITREMRCQFSEPAVATDIMEAMPGIEHVWIAFRVSIIDSETGEVIGHGVGARSLAESAGNANTMLKMGKKSAIIDAVKTTFALSSHFTQDTPHDDPPTAAPGGGAPAGPVPAAPPAPRRPPVPAPPSGAPRPTPPVPPSAAPTPPAAPVASSPPTPAPPTPPAPAAPAPPTPPSVTVQRNSGIDAHAQAADWPMPLMSFAKYVGLFAITDPEAEAVLRLVGWQGGIVSTGYYASAASRLHRGLNAFMRAHGLTAESVRALPLAECHDKIFEPWLASEAAAPQGPTA